MNKRESQEYKQAIANLYSRRSGTYDDSEWHDRMARRLVDYANITADSKVLDIATGTGMVAFYAAAKVGTQGSDLPSVFRLPRGGFHATSFSFC